jgi:hypothetical protein
MTPSIAVVTTFSPKGYQVYGKTMLRTFDRHWPEEVGLVVYYEGDDAYDDSLGRWRSLDDDLDRRRFMSRHTDHMTDYRRMPVKFSHKVWAITDSAKCDSYNYDWLIWLDADVETFSDISMEFLRSILPDGVIASYLGRNWFRYTESGFLAYRTSETGLAFLEDMRRHYVEDKVMSYEEQHDCYVFDDLRRKYEAMGHSFHDLGRQHRGPSLEVMAYSPLAPFMRHHKGVTRKVKAYGAVA